MASNSVKTLCQVHKALNVLLRCQSTSCIPPSAAQNIVPPTSARIPAPKRVKSRTFRSAHLASDQKQNQPCDIEASIDTRIRKESEKVSHDILTSTLAVLHATESCMLVQATFNESVLAWINKLGQDDVVVMHQAMDMGTVDACNVQTYTTEQELRDILNNITGPGKRFILYEMQGGSAPRDAAAPSLKAALNIAEDQGAVLVACDPHGVTQMRHMIGDHSSNAAMEGKPMIVHSCFDNLIGKQSMSYVCGPSAFIDWYNQTLTEPQRKSPPYVVSRIHKLLTSSGEHDGLCGELFSNNQVGPLLSQVSLQRNCAEPLYLSLGIRDRSFLGRAREHLKNEGFQVTLLQGKESQMAEGLKVTLSSVNPAKSVAHLTTTLEVAARKVNGDVTAASLAPEVATPKSRHVGSPISSQQDLPLNFSYMCESAVNVGQLNNQRESVRASEANNRECQLINHKFNQADIALLENVFFAHVDANDSKL